MNPVQLSTCLRKKRTELDLSEAQLARLAGVSQSTIIEIEQGIRFDLGHYDLYNILRIVGLNPDFAPAKGLNNSLRSAAQSMSTSYKYIINSSQLEEIFLSGEIPKEFRPHMMTLLEESPIPVIIMAIKEVCDRNGNVTPGMILIKMSNWAREFKIFRTVW